MMNGNFEYRNTCPACRSENYSLRYEAAYTKPPLRDYLLDFYSQQRIDFELLTGASYSLCECNRCGLLFQREIPGLKLMQKLYDSWIDEHKSFEKNKSKSVEDCRRQASEILALCLQLGKNPAEITVLDFGMGWGDWLLMAKAFGFRAFGMELSQSRLENGRRLGVETIPWDEGEEIGFDFINTEQVFEHLPHPLETLKGLTKMLKPGGILKISVPTALGVERRLARMDWGAKKGSSLSLNFVAPLEHIQYFRRASLSEMARLAGARIARVAFSKQISASSGWTSPKRILKNFGTAAVRSFTTQQNYVFLSLIAESSPRQT